MFSNRQEVISQRTLTMDGHRLENHKFSACPAHPISSTYNVLPVQCKKIQRLLLCVWCNVSQSVDWAAERGFGHGGGEF